MIWVDEISEGDIVINRKSKNNPKPRWRVEKVTDENILIKNLTGYKQLFLIDKRLYNNWEKLKNEK